MFPENLDCHRQRVYKSVSYGRDWTSMVRKAAHIFHGIGLSPFDRNVALIGSVGSGQWEDESGKVYRTDDGGITWSDSSTGIPNNPYSIHTIHFSEEEEGVVLMGTYYGGIDHNSFEPAMGMYRSVDNGESWSEVDLSVQNVPKITGATAAYGLQQIRGCTARSMLEPLGS